MKLVGVMKSDDRKCEPAGRQMKKIWGVPCLNRLSTAPIKCLHMGLNRIGSHGYLSLIQTSFVKLRSHSYSHSRCKIAMAGLVGYASSDEEDEEPISKIERVSLIHSSFLWV